MIRITTRDIRPRGTRPAGTPTAIITLAGRCTTRITITTMGTIRMTGAGTKKMSWFKYKDDPLARIFFGAFMLAVLIPDLDLSLSGAEATGNAFFKILFLLLCIWLITSGFKK